MPSVIAAVVFGIALTPVALIFGPVYHPWSLLVLATAGAIVGLVTSSSRHGRVHAVGLAFLMTLVLVGVLVLGANLRIDLDALRTNLERHGLQALAPATWFVWIAAPMFAGTLAGTAVRARFGAPRGSAIVAATVLLIAAGGAVLALAVAPAEAASVPQCDRPFECPLVQCGYIAERRRMLTVERVVVADGGDVTCSYTAWGGIEIGRAHVERGRGMTWTDGVWPRIVGLGWR